MTNRVSFNTGEWRSQFELLPRIRIMPPNPRYNSHRWGIGFCWGIWWLHLWV